MPHIVEMIALETELRSDGLARQGNIQSVSGLNLPRDNYAHGIGLFND